MADISTPPAEEQTQAGRRGVEPAKVIEKMTARIGARMGAAEQELAIAYTVIEDLEELVAGLQAELAAATAGAPVAKAS